MKLVRSFTVAAIVFWISSALAVDGAEAKWVRSPAISPDGQWIAFVARGQIRLVSAAGGNSLALTREGAYSSSPVWSPDGKRLAFASDIAGDDDVYIAEIVGGQMTRLTFSSAPEVPTGFSSDGKEVLFSTFRLGDEKGSRFTVHARRTQTYRVSASGGIPRVLIPTASNNAQMHPGSPRVVYAYDSSVDPSTRQQRVAANAGEIWLYDPSSKRHTTLVRDGKDAREPVWGPNAQRIFYLSERSGRLNVWERNLASNQDRPLTRYSDQPVRGLSASAAGDLAFTLNGQLYLLRAGQILPQKVTVRMLEFQLDAVKNFVDYGSSEFEVSPDGQWFALVARGNVFVMNQSGQTYQVTATPEEERDVSFSPDGGFLLYASARRDKSGKLDWRLYKNRLPKEARQYAEPSAFSETVIQTGPGPAQQPRFSPDGSKIAFVYERREVRVLDVNSAKVINLFRSSDYNTSYTDGAIGYSWSPNSKYLLLPWRSVPLTVSNRWAIVPADGSAAPQPLSERLAEMSQAQWSADGNLMLVFTTRGMTRQLDQTPLGTSLYGIFMSEEARADLLAKSEAAEEGAAEENEEKKLKVYNFQAQRPASLEAVLTEYHVGWTQALPDGLHVLNFDGQNLSKLNLVTQEQSFIAEVDDGLLQLLPDGDTLAVLFGNTLRLIPLDNPNNSSLVSFKLQQNQRFSEVRQASFDAFWLDMQQTFYRADLHGVDWAKLYPIYQPYLSDIGTTRELADLFGEMGSSISASHLFTYGHSQWFGGSNEQATETASLGIFTDDSYSSEGVRIAAVLPGGPLDRWDSRAKAGDVIVQIAGQAIPKVGGMDVLLNGQVDKKLPVTFRRGNQTWTQQIRTIGLDREENLNQQRVVELRRNLVRQLSNGKLAYTYLPEMDNATFINVYNELLALEDERVGAILDIRSNAGGDLYRQLMNFLSGTLIAQVGRAGRPLTKDPSDRWRKPSALVVDTFAYSDGSVFPQAYQDAKLGPLVGTQMLNTGTAINFIYSPLMPGLMYSIPILPMWRLDGSYYENNLIQPDLPVTHDPNLEQQGQDPALEAAVKALLKN